MWRGKTMDNEQKKEINILDRYKVRMIKWAITAVVLVVLMLVVFFRVILTEQRIVPRRIKQQL